MKTYRIQFTRSITDNPQYINIPGESKTEAQNIFFGTYPEYFITNTKEL